MNSLIARHLCLLRPAQSTRTLHASAGLLVGRKHKVFMKKLAAKHRKEQLKVFEAEELEHEKDDAMIPPEGKFDDYGHHTFGHLLLESVRDVRKYERMIEFELPTLVERAKPFNPPSSECILHFESSATMGEKFLAQDRKVVLRVKVAKLGLKTPELHKFLLLVGVRYNPQSDELKMSEDREATSLLNKKRLADTLTTLIAQAKNKESYVDVPLDYNYLNRGHTKNIPRKWSIRPPRYRLRSEISGKLPRLPEWLLD
ncbi:37S ribosomal protein S24, mitochondrial [Coemansia sp. RSA 988]|nr:37S ribosomal protein S24, mitochondrial [Coemansia sp. RSA 988]